MAKRAQEAFQEGGARTWKLIAGVVGVLVLLLLVLPGGGSQMNHVEVQADIRQGIREQAGITATVTCPEDVDVEAGRTFNCVAESSTEKAFVEVTIQNDEGAYVWIIR